MKALLMKIKSLFPARFLFERERANEDIGITPYRDWLVILVGGFVLGTLLIMFAAYLFIIINQDESASLTRESAMLRQVHTERLQATVDLYEKKEKTFEARYNAPKTVVDPSL